MGIWDVFVYNVRKLKPIGYKHASVPFATIIMQNTDSITSKIVLEMQICSNPIVSFLQVTHDLHPGMTPLSRFADSQPNSLWISGENQPNRGSSSSNTIEARNSSAKTGIDQCVVRSFCRAFSYKNKGTRLAAQRSVDEDNSNVTLVYDTQITIIFF